MSNLDLLNSICEKILSGNLSRIQIYDLYDENGLINQIMQDLSDYRYYVFDGRFDDILIDVVIERTTMETRYFENYSEFLNLVNDKIKKLIVPTMIVLPLNITHGNLNEVRFDFNANFSIFPLSKKEGFLANNLSSLSKHVERTIYAKLCPDHILSVKDKHFFNYPIMTIEVHDIDNRVEREAPRIIESVYSIFRMISMGVKNDSRNYHRVVSKPLASTYTVYYNEVGTSPNPPYDTGYGYSFRFKFTPILDLNISDLVSRKEIISDNLDKIITSIFATKNDESITAYDNGRKWINALLMFNEAYEFASRERFDSAMILLITILESLFLKNEGTGKQTKLINAVNNYFSDLSQENHIKNTISQMYKKRNSFVHEGKRMDGYQIYKPLNEYQGLIIGMEPLTFTQYFDSNHDLKHLSNLFAIVKEILLSFMFKEVDFQ
ncbi:MAG: HEPN domain-containing protein [Acholeplasmataceae bacterium]|nr:HEPN domain-containing protein [Acholeplasmataceae bacterium]